MVGRPKPKAHFDGGSQSCPCIDSSIVFTRILNASEATSCRTETGIEGVSDGAICFPITYGANRCDTYHISTKPVCREPFQRPVYCGDRFCYVDAEKCMLSSHLFYQSESFPGHNLFYSYSTCNSSADAWRDFLTTSKLEGQNLKVTVPESALVKHYKLTSTGDVAASSGPEYYNRSIPFQGSVIEYVEAALLHSANHVQKRDDVKSIAGIDFSFRSKGSDTKYPLSAFSASVHDVQMGLSDMAVGWFWITAERLGLTAFTAPFALDSMFLIVPRPPSNDSFGYQTQKVFQPFDPLLWYLVLVTIVFVALLAAWFTNPRLFYRREFRRLLNHPSAETKKSFTRRLMIRLRLILDLILQNFMFFFGGGIEQDTDSSLPHKLLMFGFGFLILILSASYVANLAAFLTLSGAVNYIDSMEKAVAANVPICVHPVVRKELQNRWPHAQFVFNLETPGFDGVLESYDLGRCKVLGLSETDNFWAREAMCQRDLIRTSDSMLDIPIGFPTRRDLAAGISFWLYHAKRKGILIETFQRHHEPALSCSLYEQDREDSTSQELVAITPANMAFPFFLLFLCAFIAIILQFTIDCRKRKSRQPHILGRHHPTWVSPNSDNIFGSGLTRRDRQSSPLTTSSSFDAGSAEETADVPVTTNDSRRAMSPSPQYGHDSQILVNRIRELLENFEKEQPGDKKD